MSEATRETKFTERLVMHLNGGRNFSVLEYRVLADGKETAIRHVKKTSGSPKYLLTEDVFQCEDHTYDRLKLRGVGLKEWLQAHASIGLLVAFVLCTLGAASAFGAAPARPELKGTERYEMTATGWVDGKLIEPRVFDVPPDLAALFILAAQPRGDEWVATGATGDDLVTFRLRIWYGPPRPNAPPTFGSPRTKP